MTEEKAPNYRRTLFINFLAAFFFLFSGTIGAFMGYQSLKAENVLVLAFHGVTESPFYPWESPPGYLINILQRLREHHFQPFSKENFEKWRAGQLPPGNGFCLTFDDGLQTSASMMRRLKAEFGIPSLIFIVTDFIGKAGYLNEAEIRALAEEGFGIGLHGKRHLEVTKILAAGENLTDELVQAKKLLETVISKPVNWYAYPFGEYSNEARNSVASAGLSLGFTIDGHDQKREQDPMKLPRLMYLKGTKEAGEPVIEDWLPPPSIKAGYLHLIMAAVVLFFGAQILYRSIRFVSYLRNLPREDSLAGTSPSVKETDNENS